jgi:hypothetical protein
MKLVKGSPRPIFPYTTCLAKRFRAGNMLYPPAHCSQRSRLRGGTGGGGSLPSSSGRKTVGTTPSIFFRAWLLDDEAHAELEAAL